MKKSHYLFLFLSLFLTLIPSHFVSAKEVKIHHVNVYYNYNNNPIYSIQVVAKNYATAQKKLMTGKLKKEDVQHFSFEKLKENYEVKDGIVKLNEQIYFGKNIRLSKEQANQVIEELYVTNLSFLDYLNEFGPQVTLSNPSNPKYKFTDKKGLAVADIEEGTTVFVTSANPSDIVLKEVKDDTTILLGNTQKNHGISIQTEDKKSTTDMSVDYGQRVTYRIPIENRKTLAVDVSPNFIIESVNYPYEQTYHLNDIKEGVKGRLQGKTSLNIVDNVIGYKASKYENEEERNKKIAEELAKLQSIYRLNVDLTNKEEKYLEIQGYISSEVNYELKTQLSSQENEDIKTVEDISYTVYNDSFKQGISVSEDQMYWKTPRVQSYNINFAMFDATKNTLKAGGEYVLGRIDKNQNLFLYFGAKDKNAIWKKQKSPYKKLQLDRTSDYKILKGNYTYSIDGNKQPFELNKSTWEYNIDKQTKENSALFKLKGLSSNFTYVLYPIKAPSGYQLGKKPITFKVSPKSQKKAQFPNYHINGQIMDMEYGDIEYNALPMVPKGARVHSPVNPYLLATIGGVFAVGLVSLVTFWLLKMNSN